MYNQCLLPHQLLSYFFSCSGVIFIPVSFCTTTVILFSTVPSNDFMIISDVPAFNPLTLFQYTLKTLLSDAVHVKSCSVTLLGEYVQLTFITSPTPIVYFSCFGVIFIPVSSCTTTVILFSTVPSNDFMIISDVPAFNPLTLFQYTLKTLLSDAVHVKSCSVTLLGEYVQLTFITSPTPIVYFSCFGVIFIPVSSCTTTVILFFYCSI